MNLDFLDNGLPIERNENVDISNEISKFRYYCKSKGKTPEQLTKEELNEFYNIKERQYTC